MNARTCLQSPIGFTLPVNRSIQPVQASTRDYGFDYDEEEVAGEMLAPLPFNPHSMDGYEATRLIRTICPSCKIVALTVYSYDEARKKAQRSGVDAFLVKGAPIQEMVQTILNKKE